MCIVKPCNKCTRIITYSKRQKKTNKQSKKKAVSLTSKAFFCLVFCLNKYVMNLEHLYE